jgi:multidrug efflux pump subunit AcrA (membrane-fusion protein)
VSLIGGGNFEIEANIAESDIAKVKVGNTAKVTLDAYGKGVLFEATITQIDLSETVLEGVATYKTKFQFKDKDERILPGLTADVDVMSGKKENVLYVPTRNIVIDGRKYFVMKIKGENTTKTEITTGLRGSDGRTEVLSGVNEGDVIGIE